MKHPFDSAPLRSLLSTHMIDHQQTCLYHAHAEPRLNNVECHSLFVSNAAPKQQNNQKPEVTSSIFQSVENNRLASERISNDIVN